MGEFENESLQSPLSRHIREPLYKEAVLAEVSADDMREFAAPSRTTGAQNALTALMIIPAANTGQLVPSK